VGERKGASTLGDVLRQAVTALKTGKQQIYQIAEAAQENQALIRRELEELHARLSHDSVSEPVLTDLERQAEQLEFCLKSLGGIARLAQDVSTQWTMALGILTTNFEHFSNRLETAAQTRALGLHVIRAQEEERRRLSREIHDGPAQLLNSVVLRIDVCQRLFETDLTRLRDELQQLKELVRLSLQDVRKIIFDLRPMALDDLGLIPALRAFLKDFQSKHGMEVDLAVFGSDERYDPVFEVALFRLVQEALNNTQKHAGTTRAWVRVERLGRELRLTVKDNGAGFELEKVRELSGGKFGLVGMQERTELLGGTMEVHTAPGQGTRLQFTFPLGQ
jgi:two-component system, NarL family, sensor histidine kinase DegS